MMNSILPYVFLPRYSPNQSRLMPTTSPTQTAIDNTLVYQMLSVIDPLWKRSKSIREQRRASYLNDDNRYIGEQTYDGLESVRMVATFCQYNQWAANLESPKRKMKSKIPQRNAMNGHPFQPVRNRQTKRPRDSTKNRVFRQKKSTMTTCRICARLNVSAWRT